MSLSSRASTETFTGGRPRILGRVCQRLSDWTLGSGCGGRRRSRHADGLDPLGMMNRMLS
jgi:hypothetical protein